MPRQAKINDDATDGAVVHVATSNALNEASLVGYVTEYEHEDEQIAEIMRNAREAAQPHVDQKKAILKAAAENGLNKEPFRAKLAERKDLRKADNRRSVLNEEQQADFDAITAAMGDLPLFKHLDS